MKNPASKSASVSIEEILKRIKDTKKTTITPPEKEREQSKSLQDDLNRVRIADIQTKVRSRVILTVAFLVILCIQNFWIFSMITNALNLQNVVQLQPVLAIISSATLGETYFIIKIIVEKTFSDNDYSDHKS